VNLEYIYTKLPSQHKEVIKSSLATEAIQILFHDAMIECENQLKHIDLDLSPDKFKLKFLELKKSVLAYEEITSLIHKLKQGDLK